MEYAHVVCEEDVSLRVHSIFQRNRASVIFVVLTWRNMRGEGDMPAFEGCRVDTYV